MKINKPRKEITMILLVVILLVLSYIAPKLNNNNSEKAKEEPKIEQNIIKSNDTIIDNSVTENDHKKDNLSSLIGLIVWISIFGVGFYYFNNYRKKTDLGFIKISTKKKDGKQLLTIIIYNFSKKGISINAPVIEFIKGNEIRKFKITGVANQNIYPLFIPEKQGQKLTTTLDIFFTKVPELANFTSFRITASTQSNKIIRSIKKKIK